LFPKVILEQYNFGIEALIYN